MFTLKKKLDIFQFTQEGTLFLTCGFEIGYARGPTDPDGMPREPLIAFYGGKHVLKELPCQTRDLESHTPGATDALLEELPCLLDRKERWWHQLPSVVQQWLLSYDVTWSNGKATAAWYGPRPTCCDAGRTMMEEKLSEPYPFIYLAQRYDSNSPSGCSGPMFWKCGTREIYHCPFCGVLLPEVEPDPNPKGPIHFTADGNYCDTCKERNRGCNCRPPAAKFRVKVS